MRIRRVGWLGIMEDVLTFDGKDGRFSLVQSLTT